MSSQHYVRLEIERPVSRCLLLIFSAFYTITILSVGISAISPLFKVALVLTIIVGGVTVFRRYIFLCFPDSILQLQYSEEQWLLHKRDGDSLAADLLSASFWIFNIIVLVFRTAEGKSISLLLAPDQVEAAALRELRIYIRHRLSAA